MPRLLSGDCLLLRSGDLDLRLLWLGEPRLLWSGDLLPPHLLCSGDRLTRFLRSGDRLLWSGDLLPCLLWSGARFSLIGDLAGLILSGRSAFGGDGDGNFVWFGGLGAFPFVSAGASLRLLFTGGATGVGSSPLLWKKSGYVSAERTFYCNVCLMLDYF